MNKKLSDEFIKRLNRKITHRNRVCLGVTDLSRQEIKERDDWCEENIKRSWRHAKTMSDKWMWCFCNAQDAMAFKLMWK